jgi:hypothetical protein
LIASFLLIGFGPLDTLAPKPPPPPPYTRALFCPGRVRREVMRWYRMGEGKSGETRKLLLLSKLAGNKFVVGQLHFGD